MFLLRSMVTTLLLVNVALQTSHHMSWGLSGVWYARLFFAIRSINAFTNSMYNDCEKASRLVFCVGYQKYLSGEESNSICAASRQHQTHLLS